MAVKELAAKALSMLGGKGSDHEDPEADDEDEGEDDAEEFEDPRSQDDDGEDGDADTLYLDKDMFPEGCKVGDEVVIKGTVKSHGAKYGVIPEDIEFDKEDEKEKDGDEEDEDEDGEEGHSSEDGSEEGESEKY